jgi:hypothetical protein
MGTFALPLLARGKPPRFESASGCRLWLAGLPLASPQLAQAQLLEQLGLMNRYTLPPAERLAILELLRETIAFVQNESAKKFQGKALPFTPPEQSVFDANVALWQALCAGYQHCLEACLDGDADLTQQAVTIVERALWSLAGEQLDLYRAAHEAGAGFWRRLHAMFAVGEQLGAADQAVPDLLLPARTGTVHGMYVYSLLMHAASPYELALRHFNLVQRWLMRWSMKVSISTSAPVGSKQSPLVVDVAGDHPGVPSPPASGNLRWLDIDALAHSMRKRLVGLQQGATPVSLGLGEECVRPGCDLLLKQIYERCCKGGLVRSQPRVPSQSHSSVVTGIDAIWYQLAGKSFQQPVAAADLDKRRLDEIALFGQTAKRFEEEQARAQGYLVETWSVLDESPAGMRLLRRHNAGARRIANGQLLAIQASGASGFRLAEIRWMTFSPGEDELRIGVLIMPGVPRPIAVGSTGLTSVVGPRYRPGFLLPEVETLKVAPSVVFPAASFRADRIVEVLDEGSRLIRLKQILSHGNDFERADYEPSAG